MDELYDHQRVKDVIGICADVAKDSGCNLLESFMAFRALYAATRAEIAKNAESIEQAMEIIDKLDSEIES